jgi:polyribonucleotide nucleotidyltransferase
VGLGGKGNEGVIGKGGETIQKITAECGVEMDIEQNGIVTITAPNQENGQKAMDWVNRITYQPKPGDEIEGTVVSVVDFGAFVDLKYMLFHRFCNSLSECCIVHLRALRGGGSSENAAT